MSSARRYQEDIRRIVGLQDETRGLDEDVPRMRIGGQRGIWQIGSNDLKTGSSGSTDTEDPENEEETEEPVTPDEDDVNQNGDGSGDGGDSTDPSNPLDPEVINPENPPAGVDVNSDTFGSNWASGGPKSFVDCDSGTCIELVETGGYVPPEGWGDADTPPEIDAQLVEELGFVPGRVWSDQVSSDVFATAVAAAKSYSSKSGRPYCFRWSGLIDIGGGNFRMLFNWSLFDSCPSGVVGTQQQSVTTVSGDPTVLPDYSDLSPKSWPSDNCIQLAPNSEGNWAASSMESPDDMTAKYSEAKSILNVCNSSGEPIDIYQRVGGGHVFFNQTQGIWAGSDSSGRMRSFGSSSTLDQEIARPKN